MGNGASPQDKEQRYQNSTLYKKIFAIFIFLFFVLVLALVLFRSLNRKVYWRARRLRNNEHKKLAESEGFSFFEGRAMQGLRFLHRPLSKKGSAAERSDERKRLSSARAL